jgi:BlaI family transcriptional regulator, penicillinase repressor
MSGVDISEAESLVMQQLWKLSPQTAESIHDALGPDAGWQVATVKTLLNRLLRKKAVRANKDGRRFLYEPLLDRDQWLLQESSGLLQRLFDGRIAPLVAHFSRHRRLSARDVRDLKRLLKEIDDGR